MRVKPLNAKTRSRFLASGLFLIGLSTAAGLANPPVSPETPLLDPALDRATVSAKADQPGSCKQAG